MRKLSLNVALAAASILIAAGNDASASNARIAKFDQTTGITAAGRQQWKTEPIFKKPAHSTVSQHSLSLGPTGGYSFIQGPDGSQWYATQTYTSENYYFTGSEITLYNSKGESQGNITVSIPEGENCNQVMLGEAISTNLFDKDKATYEVPVVMHFIISPGVTSYVTHIYDLASGELKHTYDGFMSIYPYSTGYSTEWIGIRSYTSEGATNYDIYSKPGWSSSTAELKKTFSIPTSLAEYQIGSVLNIFEVDNSLYYVVSQYEKEYLDPASYQDPWEMIPTENNNFIATVYNKNFSQVGEITIPVTSTKEYLVQFGVGLYGYNDLTKGYWNSGDDLQLVVATSGFQVNTENETIAFDIYNMTGDKTRNIATGVSNWMKLYDIPGQPDQIAFLSDDAATLSMVDMPTCDTIVTFGTTIGNYAVSTNIDRYPIDGDYQYVIGIANPETADNGDIYHLYAWINKDATINNVVKFNLGTNNANWIPLVMGEVLNPYLFDTDNEREYIFIASQYPEGTTTGTITDEIRIVKENGTIVRRFIENPAEKGDLGTCNLLGLNSDTPTMVIPYYNNNTDAYSLDLEPLPLQMFSNGGDGSKTMPFLISSIGDMAMIARNPAANYRIINDFSAADFGLWTAIPSFTGTLDGNNHTISDLAINGNNSAAALFASAEGAKISNLVLESPTLEIGQASSAAFIVADAMTDTIKNIKVLNATVTANSEAYATIGGIAANAMYNSVISECFVDNISIEAPSCSNIGGIAGDTRTSTAINACAATGQIKAGNTLGGIAGANGTGCSIINCHSDMKINGLNSIGGISGTTERGGIHLCYAEGSLTATEANYAGSYAVGGIAGLLSSDYAGTLDTGNGWNGMIISNNVVAVSAINSPSGAVHRIVGYTRWDDDLYSAQWDASIVPTAEHAMDKNYAVASLMAIDSSVEAIATSTEGADIAESELSKEFFASIGFNYGSDSDNPWNTESANDPCLYFEEATTDGIEDIAADNSAIIYDGEHITAINAIAIDVYTVGGMKIVSGKTSINAANLTSGIYIVVATDATDTAKIKKIAVK